jgi:beta-lactamase superfamily II metal-dependent hydrolase
MADNIFNLEILRACKGDCLLLHYGTEDDPGLALIDGGHDNVYQPFLKPRLEEIRNERIEGGLPDDQPLTIDLMMLSHIDEDHVAGLLELTAELLDDSQQPKIVQVLDLWHNTFDDIINNDADELADGVGQQFGPASLNGDLPADDAFADLTDPADARTAAAAVMVLASVPQGRQLRLDAEKLNIDLNVDVGGKLIVADSGNQPVDMGKGLTFTVVGPMLPEVKALQQKHKEWLRDTPAGKRAAAEALAAYVDKSVPNLSSIVVLAEVDTKRILFTGDARGDKILEGLELVGLMDEGGSIHLNVLKGQHHGSFNNVEPEFFERVTADHYVFSGNGEHGNPERETLEMLATARGDSKYQIHLTYPIDEIDVARKDDWEIERGKDIKRHAKNPAAEIRDEWSDDVNSLAAFLSDHPDVAVRIVFVEEGVPHTIDLGG